jgi:hypothetical protein
MIMPVLGLALDTYYKANLSINENQKGLNGIVSSVCKKSSIKFIQSEGQINEALKSYPKELILHYLKTFDQSYCYKAFSLIVKYLIFDYRVETEKVINKVVHNCIQGKAKTPFCEQFSQSQTIFDLSFILGQFCTKETLKTFRALNCFYDKGHVQYCSLDQGLLKDASIWPNYHLKQSEIKELHQIYFNASGPRTKWKKLKC